MDSPPRQPPSAENTSVLFRKGIRLRHFIILPALAMGAVILVSRAVEIAVADRLAPFGTEVFQVSRTIVISLVMASVLAWLAIAYRRRYETELQARNKELEETRDFLSSIIRDSAEGIVTLDVDERITSWNRAAGRIFGWRADEVVGQGVARMLPDDPSILKARRRVGERLRAGETVRDHETTRVRKDGKPIAVRISWSPLYDASRRHVGSMGIVLDVTAQRDMRERLVERERLAAVGELAARVAHEIRNPLAGIRAACEVLFTSNESTGNTKEVGQEVLHQIDRLNQTVSELLQYAAPRTIEAASTDVNALIDRVLALFREDPAARGVRFEREFAADLPRVEIDARQFEQVLYNLLINAAQAMEHRGSISVATALDDGGLEVRVRDTGPGLPEEAVDRLFKPFYTTRTEGTGLGLAIAKKIVVSHGGTIQASNLPEGGAEFRIRLPLESG
jgi:PAS domain S-box-containing protein